MVVIEAGGSVVAPQRSDLRRSAQIDSAGPSREALCVCGEPTVGWAGVTRAGDTGYVARRCHGDVVTRKRARLDGAPRYVLSVCES